MDWNACRHPFDDVEHRHFVIQHHRLLQGLAPDTQRRISISSTLHTVGPDTTILHQNSTEEIIIFVVSGYLAVYMQLSGASKRVWLTHMTKADIAGEFRYLNGNPHNASVVTISPCLVLKCNNSDLKHAVGSDPLFKDIIIQNLVDKIKRNGDQISIMSSSSKAPDRIRNAIKTYALRFAERQGDALTIKLIPISGTHLAEMVGSSDSKLPGRVIEALERQGILESEMVDGKYKLTILDFNRL